MKAFARHRKSKATAAELEATAPLLDLADIDIAPLGLGVDAVTGPAPDLDNEADEFVARLSDLDRFIGGPAPSPADREWSAPLRPSPVVAAEPVTPETEEDWRPVESPDSEANDFLERLSDLDRFIGGGSVAPQPGQPPR